MSLKLLPVSQVNSAFPVELRGDGKIKIKQSCLTHTQAVTLPSSIQNQAVWSQPKYTNSSPKSAQT